MFDFASVARGCFRSGNDHYGVQWASTELELVIIDCEFAGWYPSYWDYSRALLGRGAWKDAWSDWIEKMLEPYRNECAWILLLFTGLFS